MIETLEPQDADAPRMTAPPDTARWTRRIFLVGGLVALGAYFVLPPNSISQGSVMTALSLASSLAIAAAIRIYRPRTSPAWWLLAGGMGLYSAGNLVWYPLQVALGYGLPFPSVADALFLSAYVAFALGLGVMARERGRRQGWPDLLDAGIISVGLGVLSWVFLISPYLHADGFTPITRLTAVAYPVMDLVMIAVLVRLILARGFGSFAIRLLGFGLLAQLIADSHYLSASLSGTYGHGAAYDAGWMLLCLAFGTAALHPSMRRVTEPPEGQEAGFRWGRLGFLAAASLLAPFIIVVQESRGVYRQDAALAVASMCLFLLVLARMNTLMSNISELRRVQDALRLSEQQFRGIVETTAEWVWAVDRSGTITYSNPAATQILGYTPQELVGRDAASLLPEEDRRTVAARMTELAEAGQGWSSWSLRRRHRDGRYRWLESDAVPILDADGRVTGFQGSDRDVTERRAAEEANAFLGAIVESSDDAIVGKSLDGVVVSWNRGAERLYGYTAAEMIGRNFSEVMPADRAQELPRILRRARMGDRVAHFETVHTRKNGTQVDLSLTVSAIRTRSGVVTGVSTVARDITQRRALEEEIRRQALYDGLTGLANRLLFADRLHHAMSGAARHDRSVAIMVIDLNGFKGVNDTFGHASGDRLLQEVGDRLRSAVRPSDTVARLGGDEFAVLLEEAHIAEAVPVAERILDRLKEPFNFDGREIFIGGSIGIADSPSGVVQADVVMRNADAAMYVAKGGGKGQYEIYRPEFQVEVLRRFEMATDLRRAVEHQEFTLHYQPIVVLSDGRVVGAEALARWPHPEQGMISPAEFIPLAEETRLVVQIDRWVMHEACSQLRKWRDRFQGGAGADMRMSVNVSVRQLQDADLASEVKAALADNGLPPQSLTLEITEGVLMRDTEATIELLKELRSLGVRLAIDDFGIGFSSLSYLRRLPVDIVKIDRSFVSGIATGSEEWTLTRGIIRLVHGLGLETLAEGVERAEQRAHLRALGCQFAQGFYFARPMEAGAFGELLAKAAFRTA